MHEKTWMRSLSFRSNNRKSKTCAEPCQSIENLKWAGIFSMTLTFIFGGAMAQAQQPKKVPRIGYLALREHGYIEGQNIATEYRYAEGKNDRYPELVAELVRLKVDILLVSGAEPVVRAAKNATKTIPIVMMGSGNDPVVAGHVESLARPGGNVTGITLLDRELGGKRLELLKEAVPNLPVSRFSMIRPFRPLYTR